MRFLKIACIFFLALNFSTGCNKKLSVQEFLDEVNQDGDFVKQYKDSVFHATCYYRPKEFMALSELRSEFERDGKISESHFINETNKFQNTSYFLLKVGLNNGEDILKLGVESREAYARRMNALTYSLGSFVYLLTENKDTIRTSIYDVQRSYGMSPELSVLFAFPSEKVLHSQNSKLDFVYQDSFFGIPQQIVLGYHPEQLRKKLPVIKFDGHEK